MTAYGLVYKPRLMVNGRLICSGHITTVAKGQKRLLA